MGAEFVTDYWVQLSRPLNENSGSESILIKTENNVLYQTDTRRTLRPNVMKRSRFDMSIEENVVNEVDRQ